MRLPLADIGFPGPTPYMEGAGAAMLSVHFVDNTHLLVSYSMRGLVERIPDDPPDHPDRVVAALLVELPSGKVLARARWHMHDYGQYLWSLGDGRYLLRIQSRLTAIAPMANLASGDAFRQMPLLHIPGAIDAIMVSPEGDLVTVESSPQRKPSPDASGASALPGSSPGATDDAMAVAPKPRETFYFFRILGAGTSASPVLATSAGAVITAGVGVLPVNGRGYLATDGGRRSRWNLEFNGFDGESRKLSYVDSSCPPLMQFVSPSQFIVFSCRGAADKLMLSAFDFKPQEMWEEPMAGSSPFGHFAYAQQAGRFAISRTVAIASLPNAGIGSGVPDGGSAQEVRVYQVESGDLLFKLNCAPVSPSAQNFDMTPDGLNALIVRDGVIEIYALPPLSAQDRKELAAVRQLEPPMPQTTRVELRRGLKHAAEEAVEPEPSVAEQPPVAPQPPAASAAVPQAMPAASATATAGDVEKTHRKPPSLLNPGESADNDKKKPNQ